MGGLINYGFKLPQILEVASEKKGDHFSRLISAKKFQLVLSQEAQDAAFDYAQQLRECGVYALPFESCYFELVFSDARLGFLLWEDGEEIKSRSYQWWAKNNRVGLPKSTITVPNRPGQKYSIHMDENTKPSWPTSLRHLEVNIERMNIDQQIGELAASQAPHDIRYIDSLIGSLSLSGAEIKIEKSAISGRVARRAGVPSVSHSVISIPLDKSPVAGYGSPTARRSPVRLHWRRGHVRRLSSGQITKVRPSLIGDRRNGVVSSEYIVERHGVNNAKAQRLTA